MDAKQISISQYTLLSWHSHPRAANVYLTPSQNNTDNSGHDGKCLHWVLSGCLSVKCGAEFGLRGIKFSLAGSMIISGAISGRICGLGETSCPEEGAPDHLWVAAFVCVCACVCVCVCVFVCLFCFALCDHITSVAYKGAGQWCGTTLQNMLIKHMAQTRIALLVLQDKKVTWFWDVIWIHPRAVIGWGCCIFKKFVCIRGESRDCSHLFFFLFFFFLLFFSLSPLLCNPSLPLLCWKPLQKYNF